MGAVGAPCAGSAPSRRPAPLSGGVETAQSPLPCAEAAAGPHIRRRLDYDAVDDKRQRVDLVVSDLSTFVEDDKSFDRFRTLRHGAFIEVKWLVKGWRGNRFEQDAVKRIASARADIARLQRHIDLGRCEVAAVLIVDDEDFYPASTCPPSSGRARVARRGRESRVGARSRGGTPDIGDRPRGYAAPSMSSATSTVGVRCVYTPRSMAEKRNDHRAQPPPLDRP